MPYARNYTVMEVRTILANCEGVASAVTGAPAHSIALHRDRAAVTNRPWLANDSAFQARPAVAPPFTDQAFAVCNALNSPAGQAQLGQLDLGAAVRVTINVPVTFPIMPVQHRVSHWGVAAANQATLNMTVVVDVDPANANTPHVQTAYPG